MDKDFIKKNWLPIAFIALFIGIMWYLISKKMGQKNAFAKERMQRKQAELEKAALAATSNTTKAGMSDNSTTSSYNAQEMEPGYAGENRDMVLNYNQAIKHHTEELSRVASGYKKEIPSWVVAKLNRSATDISDITHYLEYEGTTPERKEAKYDPSANTAMQECLKNCNMQFNARMQSCGRFLPTNQAAYANCITQAKNKKTMCVNNCKL